MWSGTEASLSMPRRPCKCGRGVSTRGVWWGGTELLAWIPMVTVYEVGESERVKWRRERERERRASASRRVKRARGGKNCQNLRYNSPPKNGQQVSTTEYLHVLLFTPPATCTRVPPYPPPLTPWVSASTTTFASSVVRSVSPCLSLSFLPLPSFAARHSPPRPLLPQERVGAQPCTLILLNNNNNNKTRNTRLS